MAKKTTPGRKSGGKTGGQFKRGSRIAKMAGRVGGKTRPSLRKTS